MAPYGSLYVPELSKFFTGEAHITSWSEIPIETLSSPDCSPEHLTRWNHMLGIFSESGFAAYQSRQTPAFLPPSAESKKQFDSLTAPINVPPSCSKHYDITQIKDDSIWLSRELAVSEMQALKVVLLEWQNRPKLSLQSGYADAEIASLREVYASQLVFDADFEAAAFQLRDDVVFAKESSRRQRQIVLHFEECIGFAKVWLAHQDPKMKNRLRVQIWNILDLASTIELIVGEILQFLQEASVNDEIDENTAYIKQIGRLRYIGEVMQSTILAAENTASISAEVVKRWFICMADSQFLKSLDPSSLMPQSELKRLQSLISLTSIALLQPAKTLDQMETSWLLDMDAVSEVQQILLNATDERCIQAIPAAFVWSLMLQDVRERGILAKDRRDSPVLSRTLDISSYDSATGRRSSIPGSTQPSLYEEIIDAVLAVSSLPDPISTILQHTTEYLHVADVIASMYRTSQGLPFIQRLKSKIVQELILIVLDTLPDAYGPTILEPQFAVLQPDQPDLEACNIFLQHPDLLQGMFDNAAARFPHESLPLLKLCRILACAAEDGKFNASGDQYITFRLKTLSSFSHLAVGEFGRFHTVHEDENANLVELDQHTFAFPRDVGLITSNTNQSSALVIPAETQGEVISNSDPPVVKWKFEYSGLQMLGEWLQLYYNGFLHEIISEHEDPTSVASEIVWLLVNMLNTSHASEFSNQDATLSIYEEVGTNLNFGSSLTDLIFNILEQEIQTYKRKQVNMSENSMLPSAVAFLRTTLVINPSQFWRYIAKTTFANGNGLLSIIIPIISSFAEDSTFAESVATLYLETITATLKRPLVAGRSALAKNDERLYENVMLGLTQNMLEYYESVSQRNLMKTQNQKVVILLSDSFQKILLLCHGLGSTSSRLTACLRSSAELIVKHLRPTSIDDAKNGSILNHMLEVVHLQEPFLQSSISNVFLSSLLQLSTALIDASIDLKLATSGLEHCLFDITPVLVRYLDLNVLTQDSSRYSNFPTSKLLQRLLTVLSPSKPTSLLGHLGSVSLINVLDFLSFCPSGADFEAEAWTDLCHFISRDQQWLSVVILTGSVPDQKGKETPVTDEIIYRGSLIVNKALSLLSRVEQLPHDLVQAVLQFIITAQQNWPWTLNALRSKTEIFTTLIQFATTSSRISQDKHNSLIAQIIDLCSVHLQYAKAIRDKKIINTIAPLVEWLTLNAIDVNSYNASLHTNLTRNFEAKFGLSLGDFINHDSARSNGVYYDNNTADIVLSSNLAWNPPTSSGRQSQSYASELNRANVNLSLVSSELGLLQSFQRLLLEHASYFTESDVLRGTLTHIAHRCLRANGNFNKKTASQIQLFDDLSQSRAETALNLMQQLLRVRTSGPEVRELLKPAWESCLAANPSYDSAISNEDLIYWRTSLSVVLLGLQFQLGKSNPAKSLASSLRDQDQSVAAELLKHTTHMHAQIIEVARVIVGEGLRTVIGSILEDRQAEMQRSSSTQAVIENSSSTVGLADLRLISNFLTTILRVPRLPEFQAQLAQVLISTGTVQNVLRLYSYSHLLTTEENGHDPVHGEIALRLLVSLSSLNECAEELAVEGVLSQLLTARVTVALQRMPDGISCLDTRQHCSCLYAIWSRGILPLTLNLLNAVGGAIASEVSAFINTFPSQLSKLSRAFQPRHETGQGFLTLSLAKECSTLSLISYILEDYRAAGASAAVDPASIQYFHGFDENKASLISDLREHLPLDRNVLRRKIVPTTASEEAAGDKLIDQVLDEIRNAVTCLTNGEEVVGE